MRKSQGTQQVGGVHNRKLQRQAGRKAKKIKRAINYAVAHKSEKICISKGDLTRIDHFKDSESIETMLEGKHLSNKHKGNDPLVSNKKKKKKKKKKKTVVQEDVDNDVEETEGSFKITQGSSDRLAQLQAFVDQESTKTSKLAKIDSQKVKPIEGKNLIKDKRKLQELRIGQENDTKEVNKLARTMKLNKHLKNKVCSEYNKEFASLIRDIEQGKMTEVDDKENCLHSDDEIEKDLYAILGKDPQKIKKVSSSSSDDDECLSSEESVMDEGNDEELESDDQYSSFFDQEAEEGSDVDDDGGEDNETHETLLFEGGSSMIGKSRPENFLQKDTSVFDLYDSNSSVEDEDLEGFVVDDDFVEYDSDVSDATNSLENSSPDIKTTKSKRKHIDEINDLTTNKINGHITKRRRILSHNSDTTEEEDFDTKKQKIMINNGIISSDSEDTTKGILKKSIKKNTKKKLPKKIVSFNLNVENSDTIEESSQDLSGENNLHEDIYGRLRDKEGNVVELESDANSSKYIPPAQRKLKALDERTNKREMLASLHKKLRGYLNRLAESNMPGIASQIEAMFKENSRNDMNETLTNLLLESLVLPTFTPDRLVQDHACLIAAFSANVGAEVGGHIFTEFVLKFIEELELYKPCGNTKLDSKELDNLLHLIVHLFNFKVVDSSVIFDLLQTLSERFQEKEVELILLVLRSVGFALRKSDPLALKQFISCVQKKAADSSKSSDDNSFPRVRFMFEVLTAIKNNNMTKVPNYDPSHSEHLRTVLKSIIRRGCSPSELKVSLFDIMKSKTEGKWWLVGSAWSGGLKENKDNTIEKEIIETPTVVNYNDAFMAKAVKLHLSRPPRVNIFYAMTVGSEDYTEAFVNLLMLKLPHNQEQDIFNVMLLCCRRGKIFNKFYCLLANKFCLTHKRFKRLLQFALWDQFKELSNIKIKYITNLAKFTAGVIAENSINLSVFKKLPFLEADSNMINFLRQCLIALLLYPTGESTVREAFNKLCVTPKLKLLRQSLRVFILQFVLPKKKKKKNTDNEDIELLVERTQMVVDILTSGAGVRL